MNAQKLKATSSTPKVCVFYDGSCPSCRRDRQNYQKMAGQADIEWLDITGKDELLKSQGIDPRKALLELHVKGADNKVYSEMDAYILLMSRVTLLKPLAWLINLPVIRPALSRLYKVWVKRRLEKDGRY